MSSSNPTAAPGRVQRRSGESDEIDTSALGGMVGYALRRAQLAVFQDFIQTLYAHKVRPAQFAVLVAIEANPGVTQSSLAQGLAIDAPRMVKLMHELEASGIAVRVRSKEDRRSHGVFLTKKGETVLAEIKQLVAEHERRVTSRLTDSEREQLIELLHKLG